MPVPNEVRVRIATWNLEKPRLRSWKKLPALHQRLREVAADIWILTETNARAIDLRDTHPHAEFTPPVEGYHSPGECWAGIHSRWPLHRLTTSTPDIAVAARVDTLTGPIVVYATVLPYHADRVHLGAGTWHEFLRAVPVQAEDWRRLRAEHPDAHLCVAGDLNQSFDGRRWHGREWYGTTSTRRLLREALTSAGLTCVTAHDLVAAGHLTTRSSIDHVCVDAALASLPMSVHAWEAGRGDGVRLSDHNGVCVEWAVTSSRGDGMRNAPRGALSLAASVAAECDQP